MALFLQFEIGGHRYLLPAERVEAVHPLPTVKPLPGAPTGVAGVVNHQGAPVPVVDLSLLATGRPAPDLMSTRLIFVKLDGRPLGLVAERATAMTRLDEQAFTTAGVAAAPWVGAVAPAAGGGLPQRVEVEALLSPAVRDGLFKAAEGAAV